MYTGWSSVYWNATAMPLVDPVYSSNIRWFAQWYHGVHHWKNLIDTAPHWDATGETLTFAAYTGTPLEGL